MTPEAIVDSIACHYAAGCEVLTTAQLQEHKKRLACPGCEDRNALAGASATTAAVLAPFIQQPANA